jgi:hypothetical protein
MADRDRTAHHIETLQIDFAHRCRKARTTRPFRRDKSLEIAEHLRRKRFVHLDKIHVRERQPGALQRDRRGEHGTHQQLFTGIERRVGIRANVRQRLVA